MGLTEFFAMEASEYLERLDALVSAAAPPDAEEFLRLARALRGSALMANQQAIAGAAAAFETLARSVREQRRPWDAATKQLAIGAVDDLKVLVRSAGNWSDAEEARAKGLTAELQHAVGEAAPATEPSAKAGLDAGTRAFLAREGAAVASTLHEAARGLQQNPTAHDPLDRVLKVMQPLRGLAILSEIPPLSDLLEGIEQAIGEVSQRDRAEGADLLFETGAKAISRAAREITADGRANPESPEAQEFARRLAALLKLDREAVPIESLYFDDEGPHIVEHGTASARPARLGRLELVSHGEHLRLAADELERARSQTQRELRAQALASTFRALASAAGGPLEEAVANFGQAARDALARGSAVSMTDAFARQLREAGGVLSEAAKGDDQVLARRLRDLVRVVRQLPAAPPTTTAQPPADGAPRRPPAASAAVSAAQLVEPPTPPPGRPAAPKAAPMAAAPPPAARPGAASTPSRQPSDKESNDLVGSWIRYERFGQELGWANPSVEDLLGGPPRDPAVPVADGAEEQEVVPIATLCYSGEAALKRALSLRQEIQAALQTGAGAGVRELIQEVFDLLELGLGQRS